MPPSRSITLAAQSPCSVASLVSWSKLPMSTGKTFSRVSSSMTSMPSRSKKPAMLFSALAHIRTRIFVIDRSATGPTLKPCSTVTQPPPVSTIGVVCTAELFRPPSSRAYSSRMVNIAGGCPGGTV